MQAHQETEAVYNVNSDDAIIQQALAILKGRMKGGTKIDSPRSIRDYLALTLAGLEREVFGLVYLDSQHQVIEYEELFQGTLTQTSVYPREVVKACLYKNAAAVVMVHNHPSGVTTPSRADELLTQALKSSLSLIDVRVLDHIIVGHGETLSMAERGLI